MSLHLSRSVYTRHGGTYPLPTSVRLGGQYSKCPGVALAAKSIVSVRQAGPGQRTDIARTDTLA
jgi:hypothetical protein